MFPSCCSALLLSLFSLPVQLPEFRGGCILLGLLQGQYALSEKEVAAEFIALAQATQDQQPQQQQQPQGAFVLFDGFCQWAVGRLIADAQLSEGGTEEAEKAPSDSRGGGGGGRGGRSSPTPGVRGAQGQQQLLSMGREVVEALNEVSIE